MSAGCSLDDAFPDGGIPRIPKKKRSPTKGPALAFLKGNDPDPDRPFVTNGIPDEGSISPKKEGFANKDDPTVDIIGQGRAQGQSQSQSHAPVKDSYGHAVSSYFGKSETDETLSNFSPEVHDKTGYILHSVFPAKLSVAPGLDMAAGASLPLSANTNDAWKPMTSAFYKEKDHDVHAQAQSHDMEDNSDLRREHALLRRQIDTLFARLESMEHRRGEFSHSELSLFILSGLFLMFGLDSIRRFR
jgi:hypothetical protein